MKVLIENYDAKSPLDSLSIVSLCEEDTIEYNEKLKKEVKFKKLFLFCNSTGMRFSNQEIERENRLRMEVARKRKYEKG